MLRERRVCDRCNRSHGGHRHGDIGPWMLYRNPSYAEDHPDERRIDLCGQCDEAFRKWVAAGAGPEEKKYG